MNGGTCTDNVNGFECNCAPGWQGTECQISKYQSTVVGDEG